MAAHQFLLMNCHLYSVNSLPIVLLLYTHTCPVTEFAVASHLNTANSCCHQFFYGTFGSKSAYPCTVTSFYQHRAFMVYTSTPPIPTSLLPCHHHITVMCVLQTGNERLLESVQNTFPGYSAASRPNPFSNSFQAASTQQNCASPTKSYCTPDQESFPSPVLLQNSHKTRRRL